MCGLGYFFSVNDMINFYMNTLSKSEMLSCIIENISNNRVNTKHEFLPELPQRFDRIEFMLNKLINKVV